MSEFQSLIKPEFLNDQIRMTSAPHHHICSKKSSRQIEELVADFPFLS